MEKSDSCEDAIFSNRLSFTLQTRTRPIFHSHRLALVRTGSRWFALVRAGSLRCHYYYYNNNYYYYYYYYCCCYYYYYTTTTTTTTTIVLWLLG